MTGGVTGRLKLDYVLSIRFLLHIFYVITVLLGMLEEIVIHIVLDIERFCGSTYPILR